MIAKKKPQPEELSTAAIWRRAEKIRDSWSQEEESKRWCGGGSYRFLMPRMQPVERCGKIPDEIDHVDNDWWMDQIGARTEE